MRCPVDFQSTLNLPPALPSSLPPSSSLAPPSGYQTSLPRDYSSVSIWLRLSTRLPGQENKGVSRPWVTERPGKHTTCGWPFQQMDITSSAWTKPFPSLPEHTLLFYSEVPIPTCLAPRSPVAGCGLGFLKSQDSYPRSPPWRIPMHLQGPGHPSSLPFGKALPRPFCSSVCHQAGTSGTHVTTCPLLMEELALVMLQLLGWGWRVGSWPQQFLQRFGWGTGAAQLWYRDCPISPLS